MRDALVVFPVKFTHMTNLRKRKDSVVWWEQYYVVNKETQALKQARKSTGQKKQAMIAAVKTERAAQGGWRWEVTRRNEPTRFWYRRKAANPVNGAYMAHKASSSLNLQRLARQ